MELLNYRILYVEYGGIDRARQAFVSIYPSIYRDRYRHTWDFYVKIIHGLTPKKTKRKEQKKKIMTDLNFSFTLLNRDIL